jgi:DnaJ family protein C protein 25
MDGWMDERTNERNLSRCLLSVFWIAQKQKIFATSFAIEYRLMVPSSTAFRCEITRCLLDWTGLYIIALHSIIYGTVCSPNFFSIETNHCSQKIARAYEVLTNSETRKEYDDLRYDQDAYYKKYGSEVVFSFAPQSDLIFVVILIMLVINGFVYFAQFNRWKKVCDRLAKAAIEDWSPSQGGSSESKELREEAVKILAEEQKGSESSAKESSVASKKGANGKKGSKMSGKEKKEKDNEALRPIVQKLAYEITDFGAGFHKPTWKDLAILKMAIWPYHLALGVGWQVKYWIRRIQKLDLSKEEQLVLTERAVGHVVWEFSGEDEKKAMVKKELWKLSNLKEWNEEREFAKLSKSEQKQYKLMKKHEKMN